MHHGQVALGDGALHGDNRLLHTCERLQSHARGGAVGDERIVLM
jgi:hypothetical protein